MLLWNPHVCFSVSRAVLCTTGLLLLFIILSSRVSALWLFCVIFYCSFYWHFCFITSLAVGTGGKVYLIEVVNCIKSSPWLIAFWTQSVDPDDTQGHPCASPAILYSWFLFCNTSFLFIWFSRSSLSHISSRLRFIIQVISGHFTF